MVRQIWLALAVVALVLACSSAPPPKARSSGSARENRRADYQDENSVNMPKERVGRWRWSGKRKQCHYAVGNRCFSEFAVACQAAGCSASHCSRDDGAPVRVACPGKPKQRK